MAETSVIISAEDRASQVISGISGSLGALGAAAGAATTAFGVVAMALRNAVNAADELNDLSQRLGIGVQQLGAYKLAAEQSGTSLDAVGRGVKSLSVAMQKHGDVLRQAGIDTKDADKAMMDLADVFAGMPDGMDKAALAVKLFGREGLALIPMLNLGSKGLGEAAEKSRIYGESMARLAPEADRFNDLLKEISLAGSDWARIIAAEIMPSVNAFAKALVDASRESGGLNEKLKTLANDGSIKGWADDAAVSIATVFDWFAKVNTYAEIVNLRMLQGQTFLGQGAKVLSLGANPIAMVMNRQEIGATIEGIKSYLDASGKEIEEKLRSLSGPGMADRLKAALMGPHQEFDTPPNGRGKRLLGALGGEDGPSKEAAALESLQLRLIGLTEAYSEFDKAVEKVTTGAWKSFSAVGKANVLAVAGEIDEMREQKKVWADFDRQTTEYLHHRMELEKQRRQQMSAAMGAEYQRVGSIEAQNEKLREEIATLGMGTRQLAEYNAAKLEAAAIADTEFAAAVEAAALAIEGEGEDAVVARKHYLDLAEAKRMAAAAGMDQSALVLQAAMSREGARQQVEMWQAIERTAHDTFVSIFDSGKDAFERLRDTLKNTLYDLLYQMTVKQWIINLAVAGGASGATLQALGASVDSNGNLVSTGMNIASAGSSLYQLYSGLTTGTGTGLAGIAGNYLGGLAGMTSQTTGFAYMSSAEISTMFSQAAAEAALTGADAAAAAYSAAALEAGGTVAAGETAGAAASMGPYGWVAAAVILAAAFMSGKGGGPKTEGDALMRLTGGRPEYGGAEGYFTGHSGDAAAKVFAEVAATSIGAAIKDLGGSAAGLGVLLGFNTDPMGTAPDNVTGAVFDRSGSLVYQRTTDTGRGNYATALSEEVQRMLLAAIKASDVAAAYRMIAGSIDIMTANAEQLSQAMTDIGNMRQILEYGKSDPFKAYAESIEAAGKSLTLQLERQREQVISLAGAFDGSTAAVNGLLEATRARYQIEMQLAQQVAEGLKATDAMFGDSIRSIRLDVLDNQGKYDFFDKEAAKYRDVLATLTDPQMIGDYAKKLNDSIMAAWGVLDETQKGGSSEKFISLLDQADALAQTRYAAVEQAARDDRQALSAAIEGAIDAAMQRAADRISAAASTPQRVDVNLSVSGGGGGEIVADVAGG